MCAGRQCRQVPRLPRESAAAPQHPSAPPDPAQSHKCQACPRKTKVNATKCPLLPRERKVDVAKCHSPKRATRPSPVSLVPRLPRKTKVNVAKCHACHVKRRWMSPRCHACHAKVPRRRGAQERHQTQPRAISATPATQNEGQCRQVPCLPRETKVETKMCVKDDV